MRRINIFILNPSPQALLPQEKSSGLSSFGVMVSFYLMCVIFYIEGLNFGFSNSLYHSYWLSFYYNLYLIMLLCVCFWSELRVQIMSLCLLSQHPTTSYLAFASFRIYFFFPYLFKLLVIYPSRSSLPRSLLLSRPTAWLSQGMSTLNINSHGFVFGFIQKIPHRHEDICPPL